MGRCEQSCFWQGKKCVVLHYHWDILNWKCSVAKCSDPYLEFVLCISLIQLHTDSSEHTHGAVGSHIAAAPGEQQYLLSPCYWGLKRALVIYSPHLQSLPDLRLKPATFGLQVRLSNH